MKKLSILFTFLLSIGMLIAQEKTESIVVNYQAKAKIDMATILKNVPAQARPQVEAMLKSEIEKGITIDYTLKTNGKKSIFKLDEKLDNSQTQGGMLTAQIKNIDKDPLFKDLEKGIYKKALEIPGFQKYIIQDSLNKIKWKITREKSKVLNFEVRKAIGTQDSTQFTVWYAPKLAIKDGPRNISGLPGLVLKAEFEQGGTHMTITATQVNVKEEEINIVEPKGGKVVTEKEFEAEMKAFSEKAKQMMSGGVDTE